ncbi:MAG TPA: FliM/FliN family flagellar motor switch protein [Longimicrobiaceae bacterium]|jgi:flagellar motor switch protein FliM|nr:FliM/FliN family flagellar motor switch protein [Longimicrobiaceae bacterium]
MASGTLSQNEIDRLLGRAGGIVEPVAPRRSEPDVQLYDFRRPHRVSKERLRTLEAMYEQLVKTLEGWLIGRVRGQLELRLQSVEQFSFGEFILSLPTPCASYLVDIGDSGGQQGIIDFGQEFASFLVDRLFGGSGPPRVLDRALTPIERMAVRVVAERITALVEEAWKDHVPLSLDLAGFESIPEILLGANRDDPVLVATVEVVSAGTSSLLIVCLPFVVLEKFFSSSRDQKVNRRAGPSLASDRGVAEAVLRGTSVQLAARLPEFRLPMRELAALSVGGVLSTGIARDSELVVTLNGQPRFLATAGRIGRRLALQITADLHPEGAGETPQQG